MQFNLVNNEEMLVVLFIWVHDGAVCLAVRGLIPMCTGSSRSCSLRVVAIWNHAGKSIVQPLLFLKRLFSALVLFFFFCFPLTNPPFFCLSTVMTVWRVPGCPSVGAHGWVVGIASHERVLLSRGWLEAPGPPGHPPSTQLDAVANFETTLIFSRS